ncbi:hypothetical protein GOP47_0014331 [Adiantum capillus-veneris]|uniref:Uncharacterized protein n=1 Tax=Adiantum capillus-veneris TaxID=13818 RepID=A0A9D4UL92_ADICA|nr:hypothetical protein GOP47_0014331 [Adiantum capillus-veneris]
MEWSRLERSQARGHSEGETAGKKGAPVQKRAGSPTTLTKTALAKCPAGRHTKELCPLTCDGAGRGDVHRCVGKARPAMAKDAGRKGQRWRRGGDGEQGERWKREERGGEGSDEIPLNESRASRARDTLIFVLSFDLLQSLFTIVTSMALSVHF